MARKVFLSFLGTNDYVPCHYYDETNEEKKSDLVKYVQIALLDLYCSDFNKEDKAFFFLTKDAKKMNWEDDSQYNGKTGNYDKENIGLKSELEVLKSDRNGNFSYDFENIEEGFSQEDVWSIFDIVTNCVDNQDEVILDITHAFRSIPMLGMVMINYLKAIKNIAVRGVYYGAFEKLGRAGEVKKMPEEKRTAPVVDLRTFSELQDWTNASNLFIKAGFPNPISDLINIQSSFGQHLRNISQKIRTNRCLSIFEGNDFVEAKKRLSETKANSSVVLKPLLERIEHKFDNYKRGHSSNLLEATRWCIEHKLIQQGYTIISEFLPTYVLEILGEDVNNKPYRNTVNGFLAINGKISKFIFDTDSELRKKQKILLYKIKKIPHLKKLCKRNRSINAQNRDDINHGGFRKKPKPFEELNSELEEKLIKLENVLTKVENKFDKNPRLISEIRNTKPPTYEPKDVVFINLSNHPLDFWSEEQIKQAKEFGKPRDLPFPNVPPEASEIEVKHLAEDFYERIMEIAKNNEIVVHLMGELNFTTYLIKRLKRKNIRCFASTTERSIEFEENGSKTSIFKFIRFRAY